MLCCNYKRWVNTARRRPRVTLGALVLITCLSIFFIQREENYTKIGLDLLAEKEMILQNVDKTLADTKPLDERQMFEMDQSERKSRLERVCNNNKSLGLINSLITTNSNLTYCVIPRSDNTFWLQVFRFLNRDYLGPQPQSPFDLDVHQVHARPYVKTRIHTWRMLTEEQKQILLNSRVFLSVQDPYMRLWSTYLRAILLPEMWNSVGARIGSRRKRLSKPRITGCGSDVSFAEFVTYVLNSYEKDFSTYVNLCDPCQLKPSYVIKAETANRDNGFILEHLKLDWSVKQGNFEDASIVKMVNSTVWESFKSYFNAKNSGCEATLLQLNQRLWRVFIMEGILLEGTTPPPLEDVDQSKLVEIIVGSYRNAVAQGADMTPQKRKYMVTAYKSLNPRVLDSIERRYWLDFKLFAYDSHPHDIYGGV